MNTRDKLAIGYRHLRATAAAIHGGTSKKLEGARGRVAVLMYHRIVSDDADCSAIEPGMYVRASTFARQLDWLADRFRVGTLGDVIDHPPALDDRPAVALTFDDGWIDNLEIAWPLLQRAGLRATIFVVRDWVVTGVNGEGEFMRPSDVSELAAEGIEFGAHTTTHPQLDRLDAASIATELEGSKQAVAGWTGQPCRFFAYPFGRFNDDALETARRLFLASVTVEQGWWRCGDRSHRIPRIGIHQDMTTTRAMLYSRLADFVGDDD